MTDGRKMKGVYLCMQLSGLDTMERDRKTGNAGTDLSEWFLQRNHGL